METVGPPLPLNLNTHLTEFKCLVRIDVFMDSLSAQHRLLFWPMNFMARFLWEGTMKVYWSQRECCELDVNYIKTLSSATLNINTKVQVCLCETLPVVSPCLKLGLVSPSH